MTKWLTICLLWSVLLVGCGANGSSSSGSSNNQGSSPTPPDITGNWYFTAASSGTGGTIHLDGSIVDTQQQIAASLWQDNQTDDQNNNESCTAGDLWVLSGAQSGTSVPLTTTSANSNGNDATLTLSLTATSAGNSISGTYSISGGCSNGDKGTVSGTLVPLITGSWTGAIVGSETLSASLTQASTPGPQIINYGVTVNGDGFPLSGTVQFAHLACFASGTLNPAESGVQGNSIFMTVTTNTNDMLVASGYFNDPASANSATLDYSIESGTCSGQTGTFSLSR